MNILILIAGLALIVFGAHWLVGGSMTIARRSGMSEFLIGLTIVGMGTSMPELMVSMFGALDGSGDIAIGNVVGSNTANILLILGIGALIRPMSISKGAARIDMPYNIVVMLSLLVMCFGFGMHGFGVVSRFEGIILLAMFVIFMFYSFRFGKSKSKIADKTESTVENKQPMWLSVLFVVVGLAGLVGGGRLFVSSATVIARAIGISEGVISITIMAVGTSLPELATSVVAAIKGNTQLALGNVIGSNIFNVTLILGVCAQITPLSIESISHLDVIMPLVASIMLALAVFTFKKNKLDRWEGAIFLFVYICYIAYLALK